MLSQYESFFLMIRRTPRSTLFPCPTLFRSTLAPPPRRRRDPALRRRRRDRRGAPAFPAHARAAQAGGYGLAPSAGQSRSEEHTSELQSRQYLVCRLLLEKK